MYLNTMQHDVLSYFRFKSLTFSFFFFFGFFKSNTIFLIFPCHRILHPFLRFLSLLISSYPTLFLFVSLQYHCFAVLQSCDYKWHVSNSFKVSNEIDKTQNSANMIYTEYSLLPSSLNPSLPLFLPPLCLFVLRFFYLGHFFNLYHISLSSVYCKLLNGFCPT